MHHCLTSGSRGTTVLDLSKTHPSSRDQLSPSLLMPAAKWFTVGASPRGSGRIIKSMQDDGFTQYEREEVDRQFVAYFDEKLLGEKSWVRLCFSTRERIVGFFLTHTFGRMQALFTAFDQPGIKDASDEGEWDLVYEIEFDLWDNFEPVLHSNRLIPLDELLELGWVTKEEARPGSDLYCDPI